MAHLLKDAKVNGIQTSAANHVQRCRPRWLLRPSTQRLPLSSIRIFKSGKPRSLRNVSLFLMLRCLMRYPIGFLTPIALGEEGTSIYSQSLSTDSLRNCWVVFSTKNMKIETTPSPSWMKSRGINGRSGTVWKKQMLVLLTWKNISSVSLSFKSLLVRWRMTLPQWLLQTLELDAMQWFFARLI